MDTARLVSVILNSIVVLTMVVLIIVLTITHGKKPYRYFTFLSNIFCAVACLLMIAFPGSYAVFVVKFVATVEVTLTFLTVMLLLGPTIGYKRVLLGHDFWMHITNPILAMVSLCFFERQRISLPMALLGLVPLIPYGLLYGYHVMFAKGEKRWEDFYGFNKGGKWWLYVIIMLLTTTAICVGLKLIMNMD